MFAMQTLRLQQNDLKLQHKKRETKAYLQECIPKFPPKEKAKDLSFRILFLFSQNDQSKTRFYQSPENDPECNTMKTTLTKEEEILQVPKWREGR